ncbi:DUF2493 domain-containing protein [bacterium]|nr:DUF2493 domain-containing protein [bacterium]
MNEYRILVCGGRDYENRERLFGVLDKALSAATLTERTFVLIHGNARGADKLSHEWATARQVDDVRVYKADWKTHGKGAGPIRNRLMLTDGQPHVIVAFPGGNGTADMIRQGKKAGVPVYEVIE